MDDLGYDLLLGIEVIGLIMLVIIFYRQGVQNKEVTNTIERNNQLFEKAMDTQKSADKNQEKMASNLERTERFLIESQTNINLKLDNLEKKS